MIIHTDHLAIAQHLHKSLRPCHAYGTHNFTLVISTTFTKPRVSQAQKGDVHMAKKKIPYLVDTTDKGLFGTVTNKFEVTQENSDEMLPITINYLYQREQFKQNKYAQLFSCSIPEGNNESAIVYAKDEAELKALLKPTIQALD
jgi:hypothetical protein